MKNVPGRYAHFRLQFSFSIPNKLFTFITNGAPLVNKSFMPNCGIRVITKTQEINKYGNQAFIRDIFDSTMGVTSFVANHSLSQSAEFPKSHVFFGTRKLNFAANTVIAIENNDAKLDADDAVAETDTSFQSGTVTLGIDDEDLATMATLLGHEITDGNLVRNANDAAPYVGLGRVVTKMVGGVYKYKVEFLCKVKFSEPSQEDNTKSSDGVEFGTSEIEGQIATLADGNWSIAQTFDTMTEAQTYLNSLFGTAESE
jgi:hypothetical protein